MIRILLVEDDQNQRLLYQMELEDDGYEVVTASEGQEALQMVQSGRPDLVILDLALPGMDGIQVLQRIVHSPNTINPRVIIYTAYDTSRNHFKTRSADAFMVKSSDFGRLKEKIRQMLDAPPDRTRVSGAEAAV